MWLITNFGFFSIGVRAAVMYGDVPALACEFNCDPASDAFGRARHEHDAGLLDSAG